MSVSTPAGITLRLAEPADDAAIRALLQQVTMPGGIALAYAYEPSFFTAIEVEGVAHRVLVAETGGQVIGTCVMTARDVFLNGQPARIGYTSTLRLAPQYRGSTTFVRGLRQLRAWHEQSPAGPFYLASVLEGNRYADALLTSKRGGLFTAHPLCRYHALAIPLLPRRAPRPLAGVAIVRGDAVGAQALADCMQRYGAQRQCYPVYTAADLEAPGGVLRGLGPADFWVALAGDTPMGALALWDQTPFRQMVIGGYSPAMAAGRALLAPLASLARLPLPRAGDALRTLTAAGMAVHPDRPELFGTLLGHALAAAGGRGHLCALVGLAETDPWLPQAQRYPHLTTHSRIYALDWGDGADAFAALDGRVPYIELGGL